MAPVPLGATCVPDKQALEGEIVTPASACWGRDSLGYGHDRRDGYGYGHDLELIQNWIQNWIQNLIQNLLDMQRGTEPCP